MSEIRPEGLGRQVQRHYPHDSLDTDADADTTFPATYSRASHLGRQPGPSSSSSLLLSMATTTTTRTSTTTTNTIITTILGRQTEEPYLSRILLDSCLNVYNENHSIGKFVLDLSHALDQASCEIARGYAIYYDQVEFKWWEPEPSTFSSLSSSSLMSSHHNHHHQNHQHRNQNDQNYVIPWAVARPRHLIAKYNLLKIEFDAILVDCEMEANISGLGGLGGLGGSGGAGSGLTALATTLASAAAARPSFIIPLLPAYHHYHHRRHHHHINHNHHPPQHQHQQHNNEPSATKFFQMLASEPTRDFLLELKAWTADMRAFIVEETSKGKKRSVDLSRLRQVRPGR